MSESSRKVRELRGLDNGWLRVVLRVLKSSPSSPAHVRLVWELGCWTSRQELSGELGEKRASAFGQERSNGLPRRACGDLPLQFYGTAAAFLDMAQHETNEMI